MQGGNAMRSTLAVGLLLVVLVGIPPAWGPPKGDRATIQGEVVDLWGYLEGGDRGAAKKACATACAKAGNPIGLVDARGIVYVAAGLKDHEPGRAVLLDRISQEATVTGILVKIG